MLHDRLRGLYVAMEGMDGCGKSTQARLFGDWLQGVNVPIVRTCEPGGTLLGSELRAIILHGKQNQVPVKTAELLIYLADRAQHQAEVLEPALETGACIVSDRGLDSTLAYQGFGRGFGLEFLVGLHKSLGLWHPPDVTLWLDLPPALGLERRRSGDPLGWTRFEKEAEGFHTRVYKGYEVIAERFPDRVIRIDAQGTIEAVQDRIREAFEQFLT